MFRLFFPTDLWIMAALVSSLGTRSRTALTTEVRLFNIQQRRQKHHQATKQSSILASKLARTHEVANIHCRCNVRCINQVSVQWCSDETGRRKFGLIDEIDIGKCIYAFNIYNYYYIHPALLHLIYLYPFAIFACALIYCSVVLLLLLCIKSFIYYCYYYCIIIIIIIIITLFTWKSFVRYEGLGPPKKYPFFFKCYYE